MNPNWRKKIMIRPKIDNKLKLTGPRLEYFRNVS